MTVYSECLSPRCIDGNWAPPNFTVGEIVDLIIFGFNILIKKYKKIIFVLVVKITNVGQMCFHICP